MRVYVVTAPKQIRGIYETWADCKAAATGCTGARYQAVDSREKAEALLNGRGVRLDPGRYGFRDGNAAGGVGIVFVNQPDKGEAIATEISTSVEVFNSHTVVGLPSEAHVLAALGRLHNILAEMAGLSYVLLHTPPGSRITIVHDYEGVAAWIEGRWKAKDPVVEAVVDACSSLIRNRRLEVTFRHQRGHQSTWAGRDDYARWNARANKLATLGSLPRRLPDVGVEPAVATEEIEHLSADTQVVAVAGQAM